MKKRKFLFLTLLTLLFLSSCGIPNMFVPDSSSVSFITDTSNQKATIKINSSYLLDRTKNRPYSPEVNLFYIIRGADSSSAYSSLLNSFNSTFCKYPYCNPITGAKTDGAPIVEYKSGDNTYGLYQFFQSDGLLSSGYFKDGQLNMKFEFTEEDGLILSIYDNENRLIARRELRRSYDGDSFSTLASINEGEELIGDYVLPVEVKIYAAVTFAFTEYTNVWNTEISKELFSFRLE